jgi:hypothetical protein
VRTTRYLVRDRDGRELTVPSLAELATLHRSGFLADDDLVRQERAQRWVRAGDLPALHGQRLARREWRWVWAVLLGAALVVGALALLLRRG